MNAELLYHSSTSLRLVLCLSTLLAASTLFRAKQEHEDVVAHQHNNTTSSRSLETLADRVVTV